MYPGIEIVFIASAEPDPPAWRSPPTVGVVVSVGDNGTPGRGFGGRDEDDLYAVRGTVISAEIEERQNAGNA